MPYKTVGELPAGTKSLPAKAKEIYLAAFNNAYKQYKGDEAKSHATAWAAVKAKYQKDGDKWVAKEAGNKEAASYSDRTSMIQRALNAKYNDDDRAWVRDVFDSYIVYGYDDALYKVAYTIDDDSGEVTLGEPAKVVQVTTYKAAESAGPLAEKLDRIYDLAAYRKMTSALNKKVASLTEASHAEDAESHIKEADELITELDGMQPVVNESGMTYSTECFAYAPTSDPKEWRLRIKDAAGNYDPKALKEAAASLSPGGFNGHRVNVPAESLDAVKLSIREAYRSLDMDIPRWVAGDVLREHLVDYTGLTEAKVVKGKADITIIKPGFNIGNNRYYPESMLQRDHHVFEGVKMYADHPTPTEEKEKPERSVREWVATISNVTIDENSVVHGKADIIDPWFREKLAALNEKGMVNQMGVSINAVGTVTSAKIDGIKTKMVERIIRARSVDFVTEAGAGGMVELYESNKENDVDFVDVGQLRERRPDIVEILESEIRTQLTQEVKAKMEAEERIKELESQVETITKENTDLKATAEDEKRAKVKAEVQATVKEALDKAELPEIAKEKLLEAYQDAESADGLEEKIKAEQDYIKSITESGKVRGMGNTSHETEDHDETAKRLEEGFSMLGLSESAAKTAARGR